MYQGRDTALRDVETPWARREIDKSRGLDKRVTTLARDFFDEFRCIRDHQPQFASAREDGSRDHIGSCIHCFTRPAAGSRRRRIAEAVLLEAVPE